MSEAAAQRAAEFDAMYTGKPPWDIGRPQTALLHLAGTLRGAVLDAGCGTGEHALMAAAVGRPATGIDFAPAAIDAARRKAVERALPARFLVFNALRLPEFDEQFDVVLDVGLFHVFNDDDRRTYVDGLATVLRRGGWYHMLCFSDREPAGWGPRRVSEAEIKDSFTDGWVISFTKPSTMDTNLGPVRGWLSSIRRT